MSGFFENPVEVKNNREKKEKGERVKTHVITVLFLFFVYKTFGPHKELTKVL